MTPSVSIPVSSFEHAHSQDVERAVLSVLLDGRQPQAWWILADHCPSPLYFWTRNHALLYVVCALIAAEGKPVNAQMVRDRAAQIPFEEAMHALKGAELACETDLEYADSVLAAIGMVEFTAIVSARGNWSSFADNVRQLAAHYRQRQAIRIGSELIAQAGKLDGAQRLSDIVDKGINELAAVYDSGGRTITMSQAVDQAMVSHDRVATAGARKVGCWGLDSVDMMVPLAAGRLITVAAAPGCGKTSLQLLAGYRTAKKLGKGSVAIISLEMDAEELVTINLAREFGIDKSAIENGQLSRLQREQIAIAKDAMAAFDYSIKDDNAESCRIDDVCAWIRQRKMISHGALHLVCLDYLQLITGSHPKQGEREMLTEATKRLKGLARELGICILNLSQMNRQGTRAIKGKMGEVIANPEPDLDDLHGSSSIGKDSDAVIFLWSNKPDDKRSTIPVNVKVSKNRGGRTGTVEVEFRRADGQTFVEVCKRPDPVVSSKQRRMESPPDDSENLFG